MTGPAERRTNVLARRSRGLPMLWNFFLRASRRVVAILDPRNTVMRLAASPWITRLRIRAAGRPLLGLSALPERTLERASKVIVVRLDRLGDGILFSSFLRELRTEVPAAEIHLVCSPVGFPVYEHCPYIDRVHVFDHGRPVCLPLAMHTAAEHWQLYNAAKTFAREHLAPLRADVLLAPRFEVDNFGAAYLAAFSRVRFSVSYSEKATDIRRLVNKGDDQLWSVVTPTGGIEHEVLRNAAFLAHIGVRTRQPVLEFWPTAKERESTNTLLTHYQIGRPVVLAPGASESRKQWPAERFALVARALEKAGKEVVLVGTPSETVLCSSIASQLQSPRVKDICGQLNYASLFCLLQQSSGFVGNDSGPMHLAATAGIPVVVISCHPKDGDENYHQSPRRFGPWGVPHRVLQPLTARAPCADHCSANHSHCIEQISAGDVTEAILDLLIDGKVVPEPYTAYLPGDRQTFSAHHN